jgi:GR25 family glycosyltransferase involved in LPS biosynthesis
MVCLKISISLIILIIVVIALIFFKITKIKEFYANSNTITIDKTIIINMKKDKERLDYIKKQCQKANIKFERFNGIDGTKLNIDKLKKNKLIEIQNNSFFNHDREGRNSLKGSIGCALTHKKIWEQIVNSEKKNTLILEDDAIIPKNFFKKFNFYSKQIPNDWDIIFLGGVRIFGIQIKKNIIKAVSTPNNIMSNCGLYAYIVNKNSAQKLINKCNPINNYIDIQINRHYNTLNAYYIQPNIIKHNFKIKSSRNHNKKFKYPKYFIEESKIVNRI